jgi:CpeT protein
MKYTILLSLVFLAFSCKSPKAAVQQKKGNHLEELYQLMQGTFDSSKQSVEDETYYDITLHMYPIWKNRTDAKWLYVEQSVTENQMKPYRQRVYKLSVNDQGEYVIAIYKLPQEERWVMGWKDSRKWDGLKPEQLKIREGCEVILKRLAKNHYKGSTGETSCKSTMRGAAYATSLVEMKEGMIESWGQDFSEDGKQVWGSEKAGYLFLEVE